MSNFPQPTRPVQSYDDLAPIPTQINPASENVNMGNFYSSDHYSSIPEQEFHQFDIPEFSSTEETEEEEKKAIEDLIRVIFEWYEKLPESIRSQINLEKFNVSAPSDSMAEHGHNEQLEELKQKLERFKIRTMGINTTSRGVNGADDELRQKLERFKIRTVQLGEVAQEEVKR
ncbi:hypothetical protein CCACVL1_12080 [Corchorus capsularis]|uniref:Uncharacterized protein n=1 Tax=Corchorus capsularis TaxID=210143 RepID=A0A1R3IHQ9_COCAP|nr:hypothetical protein CCACVL1_12080 [Corchorus capsularis]